MHSLQLCENVVNLFTCLRHVGRFWIVRNVTDCASMVFKVHQPLPRSDWKMSSFTCRRIKYLHEGVVFLSLYWIWNRCYRQVLLIKVPIDGGIVPVEDRPLNSHNLWACLTISQFVANFSRLPASRFSRQAYCETL